MHIINIKFGAQRALEAFRSFLVLALTGSTIIAVLPAPKATAATSGAVWPTSGTVTSRIDQRCKSGADTHAGFDIANGMGTDIIATQDGTINKYYESGYGNYLIITHANGWSSLYAHLTSDIIRSSGAVRQGEHIAEMGNTGRGSGPHLHFELRLNGARQNFNSAAKCFIGVSANSQINYTFPGLVGTSQAMIANVNNCNALYIKRSLWGNWDQHMGCGQAKTVSLSPDGNTIVVVRPDNTLVAKQGYWGDWAQHAGTGASIAAAAGPGGMIGHVTSCGSVYIKTSYWGTWQEHMGCGQATDIAIAPNGQTIVVRRPDGALVAKETFWGNWAQHTASGDSQSVAAGPNGMIGNVNGCGAVWVKRSYWGNWDNHSVCNVQRVALGPDGQKIAAVNGDGLWIKSTYNGTWERHAGSGDSKSAAIAEQ